MKKSDFRAFDHGQTSSTEHAQHVLLCLLQYVHMYHLEFTLENNHVRYLLRYLDTYSSALGKHSPLINVCICNLLLSRIGIVRFIF